MINLKIKTLDSQDHDFSVDDAITVRQFKEHIVTKTGIAADLQRLIYCGRVLNDEKPLNEYNVNGKVVHLVERAPPRTRPSASDSAADGNGAGGSNSNNRRGNNGPNDANADGPFLRSIGGIMGSIGIPVGATARAPSANNTINPTSHLCMNRITVARHMLECANNIVTYLDNPEAGLHNNDMDILARQTVESTVLEVGISAVSHGDMPPLEMQNFVQAFQGAMSAAFRQNGLTNISFTQPGAPSAPAAPNADAGAAAGGNAGGAAGRGAAADAQPQPQVNSQTLYGRPFIIGSTVNVVPMDTSSPPASSPAATATPTAAAAAASTTSRATPAAAAAGAAPAATAAAATSAAAGASTPSVEILGASPSRNHMTSPTVLAEVVQQMRTVQARLDPYLTQYYDILLNEPRFADNEARETSQRVYDRVSEALHYMSHAQHAISDLMLDLTQAPARHLTCQPILIDQSAYQSLIPIPRGGIIQHGAFPTNNNDDNLDRPTEIVIELTNAIHQAAGQLPNLVQQQQQQNAPAPAANQTSAPTPTTNAGAATAAAPATAPAAATAAAPAAAPSAAPAASAHQPPTNDLMGLSVDNDNVARLIQNIVNSVSLYSDFTIDDMQPNTTDANLQTDPTSSDEEVVVVFDDQSAAAAASGTSSATANTTSTAATASTATSTATPAATSNAATTEQTSSPTATPTAANAQPRVTTATHPTTATQTRSTPRPQVHMTTMPPGFVPRGLLPPPSNVSSFDRFLPCNSHHVRQNRERQHQLEQQFLQQEQHAMHAMHAHLPPPTIHVSRRNSMRRGGDRPRSTSRTSLTRLPDELAGLTAAQQNATINLFGSDIPIRDLIQITPTSFTLNRFHDSLRQFVVRTFGVTPEYPTRFDEVSLNTWLGRIQTLVNSSPIANIETENSTYHAANSVMSLVRITLRRALALILEDDTRQFGIRMRRIMDEFMRRIIGMCVICAGQQVTRRFLSEIGSLVVSEQNDMANPVVQAFVRHLNACINHQVATQVTDAAEMHELMTVRLRPAPLLTDEEAAMPMDLDTPYPMPYFAPYPSNRDSNPFNLVEADRDPLPIVRPGSETWHGAMPHSWLPVITRDLSRQQHGMAASPQPPFSDVYVAGVSAKRRKLIASQKPAGMDPRAMFTDSVHAVLQARSPAGGTNQPSGSGTSSANGAAGATATVAAVDGWLAENTNVHEPQGSYEQAVRSLVQSRSLVDEDYTPERYPNIAKWISEAERNNGRAK